MQESLVRTVDNFLTNSQVNFIKNEVHSLRKYWKNFTEYDRWKNFTPNDTQKIQHVLGDAIYLIHTKDTGPVTHEIDRVLQGKLRARFDWLYRHLFYIINREFGLVVEFDYNLTLPAFHVFGGEELNMPEWNVHTDMGILDYYPDLSPGKIVSFVSVIESPKTPAFLDICIDDNLWKHSEKVKYDPGSIYFWNGILPHRIGKFSLGKNEYRITFQGHFYVPYDGLARLYF